MTDTRPDPVAVLRGLLAEYEHKADAIRGALTLLGADPEDDHGDTPGDPDPDDGRDPGDDEPGPAITTAVRRAEPSANGVGRKREPKAVAGDPSPTIGRMTDAPKAPPGVHHKMAARMLRQLVVARFVKGHEPASIPDISSACSIPKPSVGLLLKSPWFERTGHNHLDPWRLTDEGRAAVERAAKNETPA